MKVRASAASGVLSLFIMITLAGCGGSSNPTTASSEPTANSPDAQVSDIDASKQKFVTALDNLGIQHTDPVRKEVGLSGAKANFDLTVDGYDAGILVFPSAEALQTWEKANDSLGGVNVSVGSAALSLNSSKGLTDSVKIAPEIAKAIGGQAHGV